MASSFSENIPFLLVALCSFVTGYLVRYFQTNRAPGVAAPQDVQHPQVQGHVPAIGENRAAPQGMAAVQHPQVQGHVQAIGENPMAQGLVPAINEQELLQPLLHENAAEYQNAVGVQDLQQEGAAVIQGQNAVGVLQLQQEGAAAIEVQNAVGVQELQQEGAAAIQLQNAIQQLQQEGQEPANGAGGQPVIQADRNNVGDESGISRGHFLLNALAATLLAISILTCPWARKELRKTTTFNGFLIVLVFVVGVGLVDGYALYLVNKHKQVLVIRQHRIHLGIVRDIIDVCLLGLGLFIQQQVDEKCGIWCLGILGSFFGLFISFILITKPTTVLGFADFIIGILAVLLVFLAKTKIGTGEFTVLQQLSLMITSSLAIVLALFYRNHYEQVMGGNVNPITCYGWLSARVRAIWNAANGNEANDDNAV